MFIGRGGCVYSFGTDSNMWIRGELAIQGEETLLIAAGMELQEFNMIKDNSVISQQIGPPSSSPRERGEERVTATLGFFVTA